MLIELGLESFELEGASRRKRGSGLYRGDACGMCAFALVEWIKNMEVLRVLGKAGDLKLPQDQ